MELTTEEKIIVAARKIFTQKGFSATRTREIAEEAEINSALVNYYFRSKKNLFHIIIEEKFEELFGMITPILSDTEISLEEKIETLATNYTSLLLTNEDLSFFVLNELNFNKYVLNKAIKNTRILSQPTIENQLRERNFTISTPNFIMNIIGLTMFPFLSKALLISTGLVKDSGFEKFVIDRKQHIPTWVMKTLD